MTWKGILGAALLGGLALVADQSKGIEVQYAGALRNIMHGNDLRAKVELGDFAETPNFYALGALENLKGEILILDSKPYLATTVDDEIAINQNFDAKATLLVYSQVKAWKSIEIPDGIESISELETFLVESVEEQGLDPEIPFPFLIEGQAVSLQYHVINWPDGDTEHSHKKHQTSGPHGTLENLEVEILGFHSTKHTGIYTHHSSNVHMHFKNMEANYSGHVDQLSLKAGMVLKLPMEVDE